MDSSSMRDRVDSPLHQRIKTSEATETRDNEFEVQLATGLASLALRQEPRADDDSPTPGAEAKLRRRSADSQIAFSRAPLRQLPTNIPSLGNWRQTTLKPASKEDRVAPTAQTEALKADIPAAGPTNTRQNTDKAPGVVSGGQLAISRFSRWPLGDHARPANVETGQQTSLNLALPSRPAASLNVELAKASSWIYSLEELSSRNHAPVSRDWKPLQESTPQGAVPKPWATPLPKGSLLQGSPSTDSSCGSTCRHQIPDLDEARSPAPRGNHWDPATPLGSGLQSLRPEARQFRPMKAVANPSLVDYVHPLTDVEAAMGFSPGYQGKRVPANASACVPDWRNCAIFMTGLPPDVTYTEILDLITRAGPFGRVLRSFINPPVQHKHDYAAAKVIFFHPESAQRMLAHANTLGLKIRGYSLNAVHNRNRRDETVDPGTSRVLLITGHVSFVNIASLTAYFGSKIEFQLDRATELFRVKDRAVVEYRFASYHCQAKMGQMSLARERPAGLEKVEYGPDPCERGERSEALLMAFERIRGNGV